MIGAGIRDLHEGLIEQTARLLFDAFHGRADEWQDLDSARQEAIDSLAPDRVSRVLVDDGGDVSGWIGAISVYGGRVWEIHPLVVAEARRGQGIGRALIGDLERLASERGVLTLWAGSDDEHGQTSLSGIDLYAGIPEALRSIRNRRRHPYEFYLRTGFTLAGVLPDANGPGKPDIFLAKRVAAGRAASR